MSGHKDILSDDDDVWHDVPATWEEWQARLPEDRITLAAFRKYMKRAFDAGYDAGRQERAAMPRCETCAHWQVIPGGNFGYCHKLMADNTTVTDLVAFGEAFDTFRSRADFGCVLWQAHEEVSG